MNPSTKHFGPSIENLVKDGYKLSRTAVSLLSSIMSSINDKLIDACSKNAKDITPKTVEKAIKGIIPKEMRRLAISNGVKEIMEYRSGLILYKEPKPPKIGDLQPRHFKSAIHTLASGAPEDLPLSKDCKMMGNIMQKLTIFIADKSVSSIRNDAELSLHNIKNTIKTIIDPQLLFHANSHAEKNLEWYAIGELHCSITPLRTIEEAKDKKIKALLPGIQKIAKKQYQVTLKKDFAEEAEKSLKGIMDLVIEYICESLCRSSEEGATVTEIKLFRVISNLFPRELLRSACAHGQANIMKYHYGFLKYEDKGVAEETVPIPEMLVEEESVVPDFRGVIRRMVKEQGNAPGAGFTAYMNGILNELNRALAEKCSVPASRRRGLLIEEDVITSANEFLPDGIREHALARFLQVQSTLQLPALELLEAIRPTATGTEMQNGIRPHTLIDKYNNVRNDNNISENTQDGEMEIEALGPSATGIEMQKGIRLYTLIDNYNIIRNDNSISDNTENGEMEIEEIDFDNESSGSESLMDINQGDSENESDDRIESYQNGMVQSIENEIQEIQSENQRGSNIIDSQGILNRENEAIANHRAFLDITKPIYWLDVAPYKVSS